MAKKPIFRTVTPDGSGPKDPETLFRDLIGRAKDIKHLWAHQADMLRSYANSYLKSPDVAIELPTGTGKTLVGLLIGEFRRRSLKQRVVYLCPTRQLARQVVAQASQYGITAHIFVGKQKDYPANEFTAFKDGKAIAVSTYSGVFNSNPRLDDAQTLILDDAHAAENYIAGMWSLTVHRNDEGEPFLALVRQLRAGLPEAFANDILGDNKLRRPGDFVELVPGKVVRSVENEVRALLDAALPQNSPQWWNWQQIREKLPGCLFFVSADSALIRPMIPPVENHRAFSGASQRVYMSATLGSGGELERIAGVRSVARIPLPPTFDKRGSGRRLFLLPESSLEAEETKQVFTGAITKVDRSLILAPNSSGLVARASEAQALGLKVLTADDIEDSLAPFRDAKSCVLALTRYDGLDLPDDVCRLVTISGLPTGINLMERFLHSRIAAASLFRERILTRLTQGVGRCTRSDNDYAVVLLLGQKLLDFILRQENRVLLSPELQAELEFGISNSKDRKVADFADLVQAFLAHGDEWKPAEEEIVALRGGKERASDPVFEKLKTVVAKEVEYMYAIWNGNLQEAVQLAGGVADALSGDEMKGYRGWWYYLASDAAETLAEQKRTDALRGTAENFLAKAIRCCPAISWFSRLASVEDQSKSGATDSYRASAASERVLDLLERLGVAGPTFENRLGQAAKDLQSADHKEFHRGLDFLGQALGYESEVPDGNGSPDCVWTVDGELHFTHEAKSDQTPDGEIGIGDVRQAASHPNWLKQRLQLGPNATIHALIESPRKVAAADVLPHVGDLKHVSPREMKGLLDEVCVALRAVRVKLGATPEESRTEMIQKKYAAAKLLPQDVERRLTARSVKSMIAGARKKPK